MTFASATTLDRKGGRKSAAGDCSSRSNALRPPPLAVRISRAFTLIEVMIASGILFLCLFAILGLLANSLRSARVLQHKTLDAGMAAAQLYVEFTSTNQVSEGRGSGDFGDLYPDSSYEYELQEIGTNGLCQLDIVVREHGQTTDSKATLLLFLPQLKKTGLR